MASLSFLAAFRSACRATRKASARRNDSPATSRSVCVQSSRSGICTSLGYVTHNDEVVGGCILVLPRVTVEDCNARSLAFRLPASRQQPGEFGFIGQDNYVGVSQ